ncbi:MAG: class II aldolase/adducin family protein, partial [Pseudomonadota bacterium]|nr:class II aldolase/adducin family protein [Pseudomonadota bacterium]
MTAAEEAARAALIETCLAMNASGINQGTSGNVSVRWGEGLLITPSA